MDPSVPISAREVVVLAPFGRDAESAAEVLARAGICARPYKSISAFCERLQEPAGVALIAEEVLTPDGAEALQKTLSHQEAWSTLPIVLMTSAKERFFNTEKILELLSPKSSLNILERPFRIVTLLASVRAALQARARQYQVRDLLEQQKTAVEQQMNAVRLRDDFLSIASHELKTPITSLKLQVQMRKRNLERGDASVFSHEKVEALIKGTETQVQRLARLVEDMLDITRIVHGKLALHRERMDLCELVEEVLESFQPQFQMAGCEISIRYQSPVYGNWDRYRIEQVIANLFTNAIKYGEGKPVIISIETRGDSAFFMVQDQGMGIELDDQERIFERFERASSETNISGLGLGLFITREILDLHGGSIKVESLLGAGTTFTVQLPTAG